MPLRRPPRPSGSRPGLHSRASRGSIECARRGLPRRDASGPDSDRVRTFEARCPPVPSASPGRRSWSRVPAASSIRPESFVGAGPDRPSWRPFHRAPEGVECSPAEAWLRPGAALPRGSNSRSAPHRTGAPRRRIEPAPARTEGGPRAIWSPRWIGPIGPTATHPRRSGRGHSRPSPRTSGRRPGKRCRRGSCAGSDGR